MKYLTLILGILAALTIGYSFINPAPTSRIFMFEVNIWIYRLVWAVLAIGLFFDYFKKTKRS